jgi:hypothetical protein
MTTDFEAAFSALKTVLEKYAKQLAVRTDTAAAYSVGGKTPSPFPQHKGQPMWFGEVRLGKAYVSFHLMPLYMNPPLQTAIPANLKERMQGKTCFNFKKEPEPELLKELDQLTRAALADWDAKHWL